MEACNLKTNQGFVGTIIRILNSIKQEAPALSGGEVINRNWVVRPHLNLTYDYTMHTGKRTKTGFITFFRFEKFLIHNASEMQACI